MSKNVKKRNRFYKGVCFCGNIYYWLGHPDRRCRHCTVRFCEKVFGPDDRKTPAYTKQDGVDYVPMKGWKNSLINLLNIAGTGPIIGPIQGILFGPIAFIDHSHRQHHRRRHARLFLRHDLPA